MAWSPDRGPGMKQKVSVAESARARARAWQPKVLGDFKKSLCLFGPLYWVERKGELAGHSHSSSAGACHPEPSVKFTVTLYNPQGYGTSWRFSKICWPRSSLSILSRLIHCSFQTRLSFSPAGPVFNMHPLSDAGYSAGSGREWLGRQGWERPLWWLYGQWYVAREVESAGSGNQAVWPSMDSMDISHPSPSTRNEMS